MQYAFSFPKPHYHITEGLFTVIPFTQYIMFGYQEKITRHTKRQKTQFEETEQALEPDLYMGLTYIH